MTKPDNLNHVGFVSTGDPKLDDYPNPRFGGAKPIWRLAEGFDTLGVNVTVFAATYGEPVKKEFGDSILVKYIKVPRIRLGPHLTGLFLPYIFSRKVSRNIKDKSLDVIYLRERNTGGFIINNNVPTVFTVTSPDARMFYYGFSVRNKILNLALFWYKHAIENYVIRNCDCLTALNQSMSSRLSKKFNKEVVTTPMSIRNEDINGEFCDLWRKKEKKILYVGRLDYNKRVSWIVDSYYNSNAVDMGYKLEIIGSGPKRGNIEEKVESLGIQDSVTLYGRVSHQRVLEHMKSAQIFVLASKYETASNVILESMATGCAVIASDSMGPRSMISDKKNGALFNRDSVTSLINNLDDLIADKSYRKRIAQAGNNYIKNNHTTKTVIQSYVQAHKIAIR